MADQWDSDDDHAVALQRYDGFSLSPLARGSSDAALLEADDAESLDDALAALNDSSESDLTASPIAASQQRLDFRLLAPVLMLQVIESFNGFSIFSYVGYMVLDFGLVTDTDEAGYYAGLLGACYFFGQFLSSFAWGMLSDRFGKRPCLIAGSLGTLVSCVAFAFSPNFPISVVARCLNGILNGNIGIVKAYIGLVTTRETQSRAYGYVGLAWGVGAVVGGVYGGILARPARKWPDVFSPTGLFGMFPYLLPNLVTAGAIVLSLAAVAFFLVEPPRRTLRPPPISAIFRTRLAVIACVHYAVIGFTWTVLDETLPLLLIAHVSEGGLDFGTTFTGYVNGINGAATAVAVLFLYPRVADFLGNVRAYQFGLLLSGPLFCIYPLLHFLAPWPPALWVCMCFLAGLRGLIGQMGFASIMGIISNSVAPELLGAAHGLGQSLVALTRTTAPLVGAPLFAWSTSGGRGFPLNHWLLFLTIAAATTAQWVWSLWLPLSLSSPQSNGDVELVQQSLNKKPALSVSDDMSADTASTDHESEDEKMIQ